MGGCVLTKAKIDRVPTLHGLSHHALSTLLERYFRFDDGEISVRGASTSGMLRRAREFFDDGFSSADITVVHAVLKSIPDRYIALFGGGNTAVKNHVKSENPNAQPTAG